MPAVIFSTPLPLYLGIEDNNNDEGVFWLGETVDVL
jgi:hypothetical protein